MPFTRKQGVLFILIAGVISILLASLIWIGRSSQNGNPSSSQVIDPVLPTPVVLKIAQTVKEVRPDGFIVTSADGDMTISNNPSQTKLYRRQKDTLVPVPLDMLYAGQHFTANVVKPGEEVVLIIEP